MSDPHPEQIPKVNPISSFVFNPDLSGLAKNDIERAIEYNEERIRKIADKFAIDDQPVIMWILQMTHDPAKLKGLAAGLSRISTFIDELDKLKTRAQVVDLVQKDPGWFCATFGDFSDSLGDEDIAHLFETN